jgi:hypothetical protein
MNNEQAQQWCWLYGLLLLYFNSFFIRRCSLAFCIFFLYFTPRQAGLGHCDSLHYSLKGIKVQLRGEEIAPRWREIES